MTKVKEKIQEIIKKFGKHEKDTGSPEVQIALLTEEILNLQKHLSQNKQDKNSKGV
jgi:small subunit ribosomal protein S15